MGKTGAKLNLSIPRRGKRLGVKVFGGDEVINGSIIVRQIGSGFHPGKGVRMGKDYTIYAVKKGKVNFKKLKSKNIVEVI